ncbi:galactokinase [Candidatus Berkelbacteria bacterium]|nr:galactokinase [Candidatus Berkelbacteria bacterium]MBI2588221.1 galactokinase [Candidatus Berkelbacteria bacterium]MBI4029774.1 galactokinase [Candidatus Berkelbacteria bacterium]
MPKFILTRTPLRLSMGGGGTDIEAFFKKNGGFWTSAAIDKYVRLTFNLRWEEHFVVKHGTSVDRVSKIQDITNTLISGSLIYLQMDKYLRDYNGRAHGLEINIVSDVPGHSGLGVSGAITVGCLQALHVFRGDMTVSKEQLAREAYEVEHELGGSKSTGYQDQYIAAFGGINSFEVTRGGLVDILPILLDAHILGELEGNIMLFGTGLNRPETADQTLKAQTKTIESTNHSIEEKYLEQIKKIGLEQREALLNHNPRRFGELLDVHWEAKKKYSRHVAKPEIDEVYQEVKKIGALGGKVIGAGTVGAFWMFYCEGADAKIKLRQIMQKRELKEMPWKFTFDGSSIVYAE